jgi:hypothetical protein
VIKPTGTGVDEALSSFLNAGGEGVHQPVTDYMMNILTNNGAKIPTSQDITNFAGKYPHVLEQIPGLDDKVHDLYDKTLAQEAHAASPTGSFADNNGQNSIRKVLNSGDPMSSATQLMQSVSQDPQAQWGVRSALLDHMLTNVQDGPGFLKYMQKNGPAVNRILGEPHQQELLSHIEDYAQRSAAGKTSLPNLSDMDSLNKGNFLDVILGARAGKLASAGIGAAGAAAAAKALGGHDIMPLIELAGAGVGAGAEHFISKMAYGGPTEIANAALARAFQDPQYMRMLMQKATPGAWDKIHQSAAPVISTLRQRQIQNDNEE